VYKVGEGRPHVVDRIRDGEIVMVVNTTEGAETIRDSRSLRRQTILAGVPYFTTIAAAIAAVEAIVVKRKKPLTVKPLQEYHRSS
jgi:carbamoyl-phosphate synthase large subunit